MARALILLVIVWGPLLVQAQDAAPPTVNLEPKPSRQAAPVPVASPAPIPDVPELSELDQAFQKSSLGKAADTYRQRVEIRRLQNRVANEPAVMAAKAKADAARTDLEKRDRLRDYYDLHYGRMKAMTGSESARKAIDDLKAERLKHINQPRVRPTGEGTPPPVEKKKHKAKKSRL